MNIQNLFLSQPSTIAHPTPTMQKILQLRQKLNKNLQDFQNRSQQQKQQSVFTIPLISQQRAQSFMQRRCELSRKLENKILFEQECGVKPQDTKQKFQIDIKLKNIQKNELTGAKIPLNSSKKHEMFKLTNLDIAIEKKQRSQPFSWEHGQKMGAWGEFEKELERRIDRVKNLDKQNDQISYNSLNTDPIKSILPHRVTFTQAKQLEIQQMEGKYEISSHNFGNIIKLEQIKLQLEHFKDNCNHLQEQSQIHVDLLDQKSIIKQNLENFQNNYQEYKIKSLFQQQNNKLQNAQKSFLNNSFQSMNSLVQFSNIQNPFSQEKHPNNKLENLPQPFLNNSNQYQSKQQTSLDTSQANYLGQIPNEIQGLGIAIINIL